VIPNAVVQCGTAQNRIRVSVTLTRDGVVARQAQRDCRKSSVCYLDIDASAPDIPGDQVWCTQASAWSNGNTFIGSAVACEADAF
jgi:hypothetical protein